MLPLLPCNRSRRRVAERSKRQKQMGFIVQRVRVFKCMVYMWIGVWNEGIRNVNKGSRNVCIVLV